MVMSTDEINDRHPDAEVFEALGEHEFGAAIVVEIKHVDSGSTYVVTMSTTSPELTIMAESGGSISGGRREEIVAWLDENGYETR